MYKNNESANKMFPIEYNKPEPKSRTRAGLQCLKLL